MALTEPILDDLRFQKDIVDEARRRIMRYCPDWQWTEYNLSDPGITLVELFAWMTEMITYRLNQVPEKNYIRFLGLLGIEPRPPRSARVPLTFYLSKPFSEHESGTGAITTIPAGTEVATRQVDNEAAIVFATDRELAVRAPRLHYVFNTVDPGRDRYHRHEQVPGAIRGDARANPVSAFEVFQARPVEDDAFYLGFDPARELRGYVLRLRFQCRGSGAIGIQPSDPPLRWQAWGVNDQGKYGWRDVPLSTLAGEEDTTGGFNSADGTLTVHMPPWIAPSIESARKAFWLRCVYSRARDRAQAPYAESPTVLNIEAAVLGVAVPATQAVRVEGEVLGISSGEPGQTFRLAHSPVIDLDDGETIEVESERPGLPTTYQRWQRVADFAESTPWDAHYTLDTATGEVAFGPAIRQANGGMRWYGRIPEARSAIRMSRYRHGGGSAGNVPDGRVRVLKTSIPYIDRVLNLAPAENGRDPESLDEAKLRARREIRARHRAVTAEDYENIVRVVNGVGRVKCSPFGGRLDWESTGINGQAPESPPVPIVQLLVVPDVPKEVVAGQWNKLKLSEELRQRISETLEPRRVLTSRVEISEPRYIGICSRVEVEALPPEVGWTRDRWKAEVAQRVGEALRAHITPLAADAPPARAQSENPYDGSRPSHAPVISTHPEPRREGWEFGAELRATDLYGLVQNVPGVRRVLEIGLAQVSIDIDASDAIDCPDRRAEAWIFVPRNALLCSLEHAVEVALR